MSNTQQELDQAALRVRIAVEIGLLLDDYDIAGANFPLIEQAKSTAIAKLEALIAKEVAEAEIKASRKGKIAVLTQLANKTEPSPYNDDGYTREYIAGFNAMKNKVKFELSRLKQLQSHTVSKQEEISKGELAQYELIHAPDFYTVDIHFTATHDQANAFHQALTSLLHEHFTWPRTDTVSNGKGDK